MHARALILPEDASKRRVHSHSRLGLTVAHWDGVLCSPSLRFVLRLPLKELRGRRGKLIEMQIMERHCLGVVGRLFLTVLAIAMGHIVECSSYRVAWAVIVAT